MKINFKGWIFDQESMKKFNETYRILLKKLDNQEKIKIKIDSLEGEGLITQIVWSTDRKNIETLEVILT